MSFLQMSTAGAVMILAIMVLRAIAMNRVPKGTFPVLWGAALLRLLVPFSLSSGMSIYSLLARQPSQINAPAAGLPAVPAGQAAVTLPQSGSASGGSVSVWGAAWVVGVLLFTAAFAVTYWKCYQEFQMSLPVDNSVSRQWLRSHPLRRTVSIRQSDRISSPLTFGVGRPVILMPKKTDWEDESTLRYVLEHEWVHIQRFDTVFKLLLTAAVCVHWFNPLVWAMYVLANRDIELSCDEAVVHRFGSRARASYARALIRMEETRSGSSPLCSHFSGNAVEERITAIMKTKKTTIASIMLAAALIAGTVAVFATSARNESSGGEIINEEAPQAIEGSTGMQPDAEYLAVGLTYQKNSWYYQGKCVAGIYDDNGSIYTNDASADNAYLAVKRSGDGRISGLTSMTKKQFQEQLDKHMNAASTVREETLMSYVDPADGRTYYSFDDGRTFEPMTDAEFEARFPTPDIEWWTYDEYKVWLENEKVQLQSMLGEKGWTSDSGEFVWTQEKIDETIALYESMLEDIKNGILYSKTVDGRDDELVRYDPSDVAMGTSSAGKYGKDRANILTENGFPKNHR